MTVRCQCEICAKIASTQNPEGWLILERKTKVKGSVMPYSIFLCQECRIVAEGDLDLNEGITKTIGTHPNQCDFCKHKIIKSESLDKGRLSIEVEECERFDDPRMENTPEECEECPCYEPRGSAE